MVEVRSSASAVATLAAAPPAPASPCASRQILLVSIDALRIDMPWNGYERKIAPYLTALAKKSISYSRMYSLSSYTAMSLGGLLSGRYPGELRRDGYFFSTHAKDNLFFPEVLQKKGVQTLAVHAHGYFDPGRSGLEQGFDTWRVVPKLKWNNTTDENITGEAHEALFETLFTEKIDPTKPFFAWGHFLDPHDRYMPHEGVKFGTRARDLYDGEVAYADRFVGKLIDFVKAKAPQAIVIVTADHGEMFGEHGMFLHGFELWEQLVRVPFLVHLPNQTTSLEVSANRSAIDVAPTVLDCLNAGSEEFHARGKSLVSEWSSLAAQKTFVPEERGVYVDLPSTSDNQERHAWVEGTKKIIRFSGGISNVYDLANDPEEKKPLEKSARDELLPKMKAFEAKLELVGPSVCKQDCLEGKYLKRTPKP